MNRLIASLPADARGHLEKDLQDVQLKKGDVLTGSTNRSRMCFFHMVDWSRSLL